MAPKAYLREDELEELFEAACALEEADEKHQEGESAGAVGDIKTEVENAVEGGAGAWSEKKAKAKGARGDLARAFTVQAHAVAKVAGELSGEEWRGALGAFLDASRQLLTKSKTKAKEAALKLDDAIGSVLKEQRKKSIGLLQRVYELETERQKALDKAVKVVDKALAKLAEAETVAKDELNKIAKLAEQDVVVQELRDSESVDSTKQEVVNFLRRHGAEAADEVDRLFGEAALAVKQTSQIGIDYDHATKRLNLDPVLKAVEGAGLSRAANVLKVIAVVALPVPVVTLVVGVVAGAVSLCAKLRKSMAKNREAAAELLTELGEVAGVMHECDAISSGDPGVLQSKWEKFMALMNEACEVIKSLRAQGELCEWWNSSENADAIARAAGKVTKAVSTMRLALLVHLSNGLGRVEKGLDGMEDQLGELVRLVQSTSEQISVDAATREHHLEEVVNLLVAVRHPSPDGQAHRDRAIDELLELVPAVATRMRRDMESMLRGQRVTHEKLDQLLAEREHADQMMVHLTKEFMLPSKPKPFFGREPELKRLDELLPGGKQSEAAVSAAGAAGVGKTWIAREWVDRAVRSGRFALVAWLLAESPDRLRDSLAELGAALTLWSAEGGATMSNTDMAKASVRHLQGMQERMLLVLDNVEDLDKLKTAGLVPRTRFATLLYTTRLALLLDEDNTVMVRPFRGDTLEFAVQLLAPKEGEHEAARKLAEFVGGLPLALAQLRAHRRRRAEYTYGAILKELRESPYELRELPVDPGGAHPYDELRPHLKGGALPAMIFAVSKVSPSAQELLKALAVLSPDRVPIGVVLGVGSGKALAELVEASLVMHADEANKFVDCHRIVQLVAWGFVVPHSQRSRVEVLMGVAESLLAYAESFDEHKASTWAVMREVVAHCEALFKTEGELRDGGQPVQDTSSLRKRLCIYYTSCSSQLNAALPHRKLLLDDVQARQQALGSEENLDVAASLNNLAVLHQARGEFDKALPLYEKSLRIRKQALGDEHPHVATSLNNLAGLHQVRGEYGKALPLYEESLRIRKQALGDEHPDVAASLGNLAGLHQARGEYGKALPLCEESLRIWRQALGDEHPHVAMSLRNLAELHKARGEYVKALPLYEESLRISKQALDDEHPDVAMSLNNLSELHKARGEYAKALPLYEESLRISKQALGEGHPDVATSLNNLAGLHQVRGEYDKALPLCEESLRIRKQALGDEHPHVAASLGNLAGLHEAQGEYDKALPLYEESLRIRKQALGDEHPYVATSLNNLAGLHQVRGEYAKALPLYEESLRISKQALGDEHPDVAASLNNLAELYQARGEYGKALPLCEELLRIRKQALGDKHPDVAMSLRNLAGLHEARGEYDKALPLYKESLRILMQVLVDGHPLVEQTMRKVLEMEIRLSRLPAQKK